MKKSLIISTLVILLIVLSLGFLFRDLLFSTSQFTEPIPVVDVGVVVPDVDNSDIGIPISIPSGMETINFSGELEDVNVGCFADGECYVVIDGKHVTVLIGRVQQAVGTIIGVDSFGGLENFVGEKVEIFAQDLGSEKYTLYGSEAFYLKVLEAGGAGVRINESIDVLGNKITPLQILEDSRCPIDVQCIQAGTVRLRAILENSLGKSEQVFILGESVTTENEFVSMVRVEPSTDSKTTINDTEYTFYFKVKKR